jgi:hypothetical protein
VPVVRCCSAHVHLVSILMLFLKKISFLPFFSPTTTISPPS